MRRRTIALPLGARQLPLYLVALAAGGGLALVVAAADADVPATASITARDYSFDNGSVTITPGGTVSFGYPTGSSFHNVNFATEPTSCTGMPTAPAGPGWSGSCTFNSPGTYSFVCDQHYYMTGKVEVVDPNAPTTGTTETTSPESTPPSGELAPPSVKVARRQVGTVVRGKVTTPAGSSKIAVTAFVAKRALAARSRPVKVGSVTKTATGTGATAFALKVSRAARRALRRRHRLPVSLRIVITPDGDYAVRKTATVVLRERS